MRKILFVLFTLLIAAGLVSCEKKAKPAKLRVSYFSTVLYDPLVQLADAKGWFKDEGLDVELYSFTKGPEINDAILSGDLDIGYAVGDQPFIAQAAREKDAVIISTASLQGINQGLAGAKDIKSVADLKGKKIAVLLGTMYHKQCLAILAANGLSADDVELVNIFGNESYVALEKGEVSAIEYGNAWGLKQIEDIGGHKLQDATISPGQALTYTTRKFATEHQEEVVKFLKVLYKAQDYLLNNSEDAYKTIAEFMNVTTEQVRVVNTNNQLTTGIQKDIIPHLQNTYNFLKERNYTKAEIDDFSQFIDPTYVNKAYEEYKGSK